MQEISNQKATHRIEELERAKRRLEQEVQANRRRLEVESLAAQQVVPQQGLAAGGEPGSSSRRGPAPALRPVKGTRPFSPAHPPRLSLCSRSCPDSGDRRGRAGHSLGGSHSATPCFRGHCPWVRPPAAACPSSS